MDRTEHYKLSLPGPDDPVDIEALDGNFRTLDEKLHEETEERERSEELLRSNFSSALEEFGSSVIKEITIPSNGWVNDGGTYHFDLSVQDANENQVPVVSVSAGSLSAAKAAEISTVAQTLEGKVRFWAKAPPGSGISATLALLYPKRGESAGGGQSYVLPTATDTRLGGVKIGESVNVSSDGTISVDREELMDDLVATDEEVRSTIDGIFSQY